MQLKLQAVNAQAVYSEQQTMRTALNRALLVAVLGCSLGFSFSGVHGQEDVGSQVLLDNARLIIGDGEVIENAALLMQGNTIVAAGSRAEMSLENGVSVIDLSGKTIIPALIDSHAHLGYEGYSSWGSQNYSRENLIEHLQRYAYYGFSAVFSAGSDPDRLAFSVQQAQQRRDFAGARFLFAAGMAPPEQGPNNQFLSQALAIQEQTAQPVLYGVASVEQAQSAVREIAARGLSVIKIWVDDRGGTQQKLPPPLYRAITSSAAENGLVVYAHQQSASDMPDLLEAGVDGFLHGRIGPNLGQNIAQLTASANAFVVPNLGLGELRREAIGVDPFLRSSIPASVAYRLGVSQQRQLQPGRDTADEAELRTSLGHLLDAGVDILLGTDAGAVPDHFFGYSGHRELEILVRLGMTPMQAIISATSKPAQRLGLDGLGLLREGYSADIVVLDENPLEDIRNTRTISAVFLNGKLIDREQLAEGFVN